MLSFLHIDSLSGSVVQGTNAQITQFSKPPRVHHKSGIIRNSDGVTLHRHPFVLSKRKASKRPSIFTGHDIALQNRPRDSSKKELVVDHFKHNNVDWFFIEGVRIQRSIAETGQSAVQRIYSFGTKDMILPSGVNQPFPNFSDITRTAGRPLLSIMLATPASGSNNASIACFVYSTGDRPGCSVT